MFTSERVTENEVFRLLRLQQFLNTLPILLPQVRREGNLGEYPHARMCLDVLFEFGAQAIGKKQCRTLALFGEY